MNQACSNRGDFGLRHEKIAAGVKMGMIAGMIAHHSRGFAMRKAAAASMAPTRQMRIAILIAQERSGNTCIQISLCPNQ